MSLQQKLNDLAASMSGRVRGMYNAISGEGPLTTARLTTNARNLVDAVNEVAARPSGVSISDNTTTGASTWSSQRVQDAITEAISAIVAGAPDAVNTLAELSAAIGNDANFGAAVTAALGKRVRVDTVTALTATEQSTGRANIGAQSAAEIGNTDVDLAAIFTAGLA